MPRTLCRCWSSRKKYPVEELRELKIAHENLYRNANFQISDELVEDAKRKFIDYYPSDKYPYGHGIGDVLAEEFVL